MRSTPSTIHHIKTYKKKRINMVSPKTIYTHMLLLSGLGSEETPNWRPADSPAEDEETNENCGTLLALEMDTKLATVAAAFGSFGETILSPKLNMGVATFNSLGGSDLSDVEDDCLTAVVG